MATYGIQNLDDTLEAADYRVKADKAINPAWKEIALRKIAADTGYTDSQKYDALENVLQSQERVYSNASEPEIIAYLQKHLASLPNGLGSVLGSLFNLGLQNTVGNVNPDLKMAVMQGFKKYISKKGKTVVSISLRKMLRPSDRASSYDKLVLLKAKRIVKLLRQSMASANMTADVTLSKSYQKIRGGYNRNKYYFNPSARTSLTKQIAKKYGTIELNAYKTAANTALNAGLDGAKAKINALINQGGSIANINRNSTVADRKGFRDAYSEAFLSKGRKVRNIQNNQSIQDVIALLNQQQPGRVVEFETVPVNVQVLSAQDQQRLNAQITAGLSQQERQKLINVFNKQGQNLDEDETQILDIVSRAGYKQI